jgi:hypothetical protein
MLEAGNRCERYQRQLISGIVAADDVPQLRLPHDLFAESVRNIEKTAKNERRGKQPRSKEARRVPNKTSQTA